MNLPEPTEGSASPYSGNSLRTDFGGEQAGHLPVIMHSQDLVSHRNDIIDPLPERDAETAALEATPRPTRSSTFMLSHSPSSAAVMTKWTEDVYFKWVPLADNGNELRHATTSALVHPTSIDQSPSGMCIAGMRGPNIESIATCLLDLVCTYAGGPVALRSNEVTLDDGFQVRNLFNNVRSWHA